jgi:hypothetical protein
MTSVSRTAAGKGAASEETTAGVGCGDEIRVLRPTRGRTRERGRRRGGGAQLLGCRVACVPPAQSRRIRRKHLPATVVVLKEEQRVRTRRLTGLHANIARSADAGATKRSDVNRHGRPEPFFHLLPQGLNVRAFHFSPSLRCLLAAPSSDAARMPSFCTASRASETTLTIAPKPSKAACFGEIATNRRIVQKPRVGRVEQRRLVRRTTDGSR